MFDDAVHAVIQLENVEPSLLTKHAESLNGIFKDKLNQQEIQFYQELSLLYRPFINAARIAKPTAYPGLETTLELVDNVKNALNKANTRLTAQVQGVKKDIRLQWQDAQDISDDIKEYSNILRNAGFNSHAVDLEMLLNNVPQQHNYMKQRLTNHEHRLTELQNHYDTLAKQPAQKGTYSKTRNLYGHVAAFTEQVEQLHDEIEESHDRLIDRANTLVAGASSLESLTESLSRDAKQHSNRRLGWLAAKIGSCIVVAAGALQLIEPYEILMEKYVRVESTSKPSIPATLSELDSTIQYALYIDRQTRTGTLYDLATHKVIHTGSCSFAKIGGDKQYAGDGRTQNGVFAIEGYVLGESNPLYGAAYINLEDKPFSQMQVVGASLSQRINAIKQGKDSTNGAVAFLNEDITSFVKYIAAHGARNGRIVIESSQR